MFLFIGISISQSVFADNLGAGFSECITTGSSPVGYSCPLAQPQINNTSIRGTDNAWSVFVGGNFHVVTGVEAEGKIFVGGDFLLDSGIFYNTGMVGVGSRVIPENGQDFLTVAGDVNVGDAATLEIGGATGDFLLPLSEGNLVIGGALNTTGTGIARVNGAGTLTQAAFVDPAIAAQFTDLITLSDDLSALTDSSNALAEFFGWEIRLRNVGATSSEYVFNINRDLDNNSGAPTSLVFDGIPLTSTVVINMTGSGTVNLNLNNVIDLNGNSGLTFDPEFRSRILWNFPNASQVNLLGWVQFEGSILAPNASTSLAMNVPGHNGRLIVGGDVEHAGTNNEFHNYPFIGNFTFPPTDADLSLTNTVNDPTPNMGDTVIYTVTVQNDGPLSATGVDVNNSLPAGLTFVSASPSVGSYNDGTGIWSVGTLANGAQQTLQISANVAASGITTNTAQVTASDQTDPDSTPNNGAPAEDDQSSIDITVPEQADLRLTKAVDDATPTLGDNVVFTITVNNDGPDTATNVTVLDLLPAGFTYVSDDGGGAYVSGTGLWTIGSLVNGGSDSVQVTASVNTSGALTNTAQINTSDQQDPDSNVGNNAEVEDDQFTIALTVSDEADLVLTKTDGSATFTPGSTVIYTITALNTGPSSAVNTVVTDSAPAGTTITSWSCTDLGGATCPIASGSGDLIQTAPVLVMGGSLIYTLNLEVPSGFTPAGNLVNTATISSDTFDPNAVNDSATDTDTPTPSFDLGITVTDGVATYTAGQAHPNYTVVVSNTGPSDAFGVLVSTAFSGTSSIDSWTCIPENGAFLCPNASGSGAISETFINFPAGAKATFTINLTIPDDETGNLVATSTVTAAGDGNAGNNAATDTDSAAPVVDYQIDIDDGISNYPPPVSATSYSIVLTNNGPSDGTASSFDFNEPADTNITSWTCVAGGGVVCPAGAGGAGNISESIGSFPVAGTLTYSVNLAILAGHTGDLVASTSISTAETDSNAANNNSLDIDSETAVADLVVSLNDGTSTYIPGGTQTYSLVAINSGGADASNATIHFNAPSSTTVTGWTCADTGTVTCPAATGSGNISETSGVFAVGDTLTYTITLSTLSGRSGNLTATATVSTTDLEPNLSNNSTSDADTSAPNVDYSVTIDDGVTTYAPGGTLVYTVVVANAGPSDGTNSNLSVTDVAGVAVSSWTCVSAGGVSCPALSGVGTPNQVFTTFPSGASVTYTANAVIDPDFTTNLIAELTISSTDNDTNLANNTNSDIDTPAPQADVSVTKTDGSATFTPGTSVNYVVVVANAGPSNAANVVITDTAPAGTAISSWSCASSAGATCPNAGGSGNLNESTLTLDAGENLTYTVSLDVPSGFTGNLTNTASATTTTGDSNLVNNSASDSNTENSLFDVVVTVDDGVTTYVPGGSHVSYQFALTNNGPSDSGVVDAALTFTAGVVTGNWTCIAELVAFSCPNASGTGDISESFPSIPSGGRATYTVTVLIPSSQTGNVDATGTSVMTPADIDAVVGNDTATDTDTPVTEVDYQVHLTDGFSDYLPGATNSYTLTVANNGPSDGTTSTITYSAPTDATTGNWTCVASGGVVCPADSSGDINEAIGNFPVGAQLTFTIDLAIGASRTGNLSTLATVATTDNDSDLTNNTNIDVDSDIPITDLSVAVTDGVTQYTPGVSQSYQLTVSNIGLHNASDAHIILAAPAGSNITGWTCADGATVSCPAASGVGDISQTTGLFSAGDHLTYTVLVASDTNRSGDLQVQASVSTTSTESELSNNSATDIDIALLQVDYQVSIDDGVSTYVPGEQVSYIVVIENHGPSDSTNATLSGTGFAGVTDINWTCTALGGAFCPAASGSGITSQTITTLPSGGRLHYNVVADIDAGKIDDLTANVQITSTDNDLDLTNNADSDVDTYAPISDLSVTKTDGQATYTPGNSNQYSVVVNNLGPSTAYNVVITDIAPSGTSISGWSCIASTSTSCPAAGGTGTLNETVAAVPVGETLTYSVNLSITGSFTGDLINTVIVSSDSQDLDGSNNSDTDTDTQVSVFDMAIGVNDHVSTYTAGEAHAPYQLVVTNLGPSDVTNTPVNLTFTPGVITDNWTCVTTSGSFACPITSGSGSVSNTFTYFPVGGVATYTVNTTIPSSQTGDLTATATVSAAGDSSAANDVDTDIDSADSEMDYQVSIDNGITQYSSPGTSTYTVTVNNLGLSDGTNALVSINAPANTSITSWTCSGSGGVSCDNASGSGNISEIIGAFPVSGQLIYSVTLNIVGGRTGQLTETATVSTSDNDIDMTNNQDNDIDSENAIVDLTVTLDDGTTQYTPGNLTTYTLIMTNSGNTAATNALISFVAPANTAVSWSCTDGTISVCPADTGLGNISELIGAVPVGDGLTYSIVLATDSDRTGDLVATASVNTTDPEIELSNNSANDTDLMFKQVDYEVSIDDGTGTYSSGDTLTYTVIVTNNGPSDGSSSVLTVGANKNIDARSWTCTAAGGVVCPAATGTGTPNQNYGVFPSGATLTYQALVDIGPAINGNLTTFIDIDSVDNDINATNDHSEDTDIPGGNADLSIVKTNGTDSYSAGSASTYTITVLNRGSDSATNVVVSDVPPSGTILNSWTCVAAGGATCLNSNGSGNISETMPNLPSGGSLVYNANVAVNAGFTGSLTNTATVYSDTVDSDISNNSSSDTDTELVAADLSISKSDGSLDYLAGTQVQYQIVVENLGPFASSGVSITDSAPAGTTIPAWSCSASNGVSCPNTSGSGDLNEAISDMSAGSRLTYMVSVDIPSNFSGTLTNTAQVSATTSDPNSSNNTSFDTNVEANLADISVIKTDSSATYQAGTQQTYLIVFANAGPSDADSVVLADSAPSNAAITHWGCISATVVTCPLATGSGDFLETISTLPAGASLSYEVVVETPWDFSGDLLNTANISSSTPDLDVSNNNSTDTDVSEVCTVNGSVFRDADISSTITVGDTRYGNNIVAIVLAGADGIWQTNDDTVVATTTTDVNGIYTYTGPYCGEVVVRSNAPNVSYSDASFLVNLDPLAPTTVDFPFIDPAGMVYDAVTKLPIASATVSIYQDSNTNGIIDVGDVLGYQIVTAADGRYSWLTAWPANYLIDVVVPAASNYSWPSQIIPAANAPTPLTPGLNDVDGVNTEVYYLSFQLAFSSGDLINNDIPLDPSLSTLVNLVKSVSVDETQKGEQIQYQLSAENQMAFPLDDLNIEDIAPLGFVLQADSIRLIRAGADTLLNTADDTSEILVGSVGRPNVFSDIDLAANEIVSIRYLMNVSASATLGPQTNTAQAVLGAAMVGNRAQATVILRPDALVDNATIVGKVFHDRDGDGYQEQANASNVRIDLTEFGPDIQKIVILSGPDEAIKFDKAKRQLLLGNLQSRQTFNQVESANQWQLQVNIGRIPDENDSFKLLSDEGWQQTFYPAIDGEELSHQGMVEAGINGQNLTIRWHADDNDPRIYFVVITNTAMDEEGIAGARVVSQDGLLIDVDEAGRFNVPVNLIEHRRGENYLLEVDQYSLPVGSIFTTDNPRILRLTGTSLNLYEFGIQLPEPVMLKNSIREQRLLAEYYFETDSASLTTTQISSLPKLAAHIEELDQSTTNGELLVSGHADIRHFRDYNVELGVRRGLNVLQDLDTYLAPQREENFKRYQEILLQGRRLDIPVGQDACYYNGEFLGFVAEIDRASQHSEAARCVSLVEKFLVRNNVMHPPWIEWFMSGEQLGVSLLENLPFEIRGGNTQIGIAGVDHRLAKKRNVSERIDVISNECLISEIILGVGEQQRRWSGVGCPDSRPIVLTSSGDTQPKVEVEHLIREFDNREQEDELSPNRRVDVIYLGNRDITAPVELQIRQQPFVIEPRLSVRGPKSVHVSLQNLTEPLSVSIGSNYIPFIGTWKLEIFSGTDHKLTSPLIVKQGEFSASEIDVIFEPKDFLIGRGIKKLRYRLTVANDQGYTDQTQAKSIRLYRGKKVPASDQRHLLDSANDLTTQTIPLIGSRVIISGDHLSKNGLVVINKEEMHTGQNGKFVFEQIYPLGSHHFEVVYHQDDDIFHRTIELDVAHDDWMLVGLGELTAGNNWLVNISDNEIGNELDRSLYLDGQLSVYLKGYIKGKYLLTAAIDTGDSDVFNGDSYNVNNGELDDLSQINPDDLYPVYGDDSVIKRDINSTEMFYVALQSKQFSALLGRRAIVHDDSELVPYFRTLQGLHISAQTLATDDQHKPKAKIDAAVSVEEMASAQDLLMSTGGRLYFLSQRSIIANSEIIRLVIVDRVTGMAVGESILVADKDYQLNAHTGELWLNEPLVQFSQSTFPTIIGNTSDLSDRVYLKVNYNYQPTLNSNSLAGAVQADTTLSDWLRVGGGLVQDTQNNVNNQEASIFAELTNGQRASLRYEVALTNSNNIETVQTSNNGGLSFTAVNIAAANDIGLAHRLDGYVDVSEFFKLNSQLTGWWQQSEDSFRHSQTQSDQLQAGVEVKTKFSERNSLAVRVTTEQLATQSLNTAVIVGQHKVGEKLLWDWQGQYQQIDDAVVTEDFAAAGSQLTYSLLEGVDLYGRGSLQMNANTELVEEALLAVGSNVSVSKNWSLGTEIYGQESSIGGWISADYQLSDYHQLYARTQLDIAGQHSNQSVLAGNRYQPNEQTTLYSEVQTINGDERGTSAAFGIDQQVTDELTLGFSSSYGEFSEGPLAAQQSTERAQTQFYGKWQGISVSGYGSVEWHEDSGDEDSRQVATQQRWLYKLNSDWRVNFRLQGRLAEAEVNGQQLDATELQTHLGFSYRPSADNRWNVLARYSFVFQDDEINTATNAQRHQTVAGEARYRPLPDWSYGAKVAYRFNQQYWPSVGSQWYQNDLAMMGGQVIYHTQNEWDVMVEYRGLLSLENRTLQHGPLVNVNRHITEPLVLGVGYNFTHFNDDLSNLNYAAHGFFVNGQYRF